MSDTDVPRLVERANAWLMSFKLPPLDDTLYAKGLSPSLQLLVDVWNRTTCLKMDMCTRFYVLWYGKLPPKIWELDNER